jgi:DNA polymerase
MKSYNLELLKISGVDFVFKKNLKQTTTSSNTTNLATQPIPSHQPTLDSLKTEYSNCQKCPLHETRNHFVYGDGNPHAEIMIIGEGPGAKEDLSGKVFVGPAGELLTKMLKAMF